MLNETEQALFESINKLRLKGEKTALILNEYAQSICKEAVQKMCASSSAFGHDEFPERLKLISKDNRVTHAAENLIKGPPQVEKIIEQWVNSELHKKNIFGNFNQTAVVAQEVNAQEYIVLQFFFRSDEVPQLVQSPHNPKELLAKDILRLVNEYRLKMYRPMLTDNNFIQKVAQEHSEAMAKNEVPFSHANFEQRAQRVLKELNKNTISENVAMGQANAQDIVKKWINSDGHRKNIEGHFTYTGIGIQENEEGVYFYTQIFVQ